MQLSDDLKFAILQRMREQLIEVIDSFRYGAVNMPAEQVEKTLREMNAQLETLNWAISVCSAKVNLIVSRGTETPQ